MAEARGHCQPVGAPGMHRRAIPRRRSWPLLLAGLLLPAVPALAQDAAADHPQAHEPDNGTDPTRIRRSLTVDFEHFDLRGGFTSDTLEVDFNQPLSGHTGLAINVPLPSVDTAGNHAMGFGDVEVLVTHIPVVTRTHGIVIKGGAAFDTASRPELGAGQTVLEATFIYARFLRGGAIFAPSFEFNYGVDRDPGRARVEQMTADFYYVPKLENPNYYMTLDPFVNFDFAAGEQSGGLTVTLGRVIGPALGGRLQAYVKPGVFIGSHRSADWGVETGLKLIGF